MQPIISGREGNRIRIEVTIDLSGSMLEAEESILRGVNAVGDAATAEALQRFDADGDPIAIGDAKWYSKGKLPKTYNTPYGVISVERHVYQRAEGGKTLCPMDDGARIIRKATPRFAKIVSHKFANGAAAQVMDDLEQNHGRCCLKASLQDLATHVGTVVQAKEENWNYATPELAGKVTTVGIGVDGTCMLICDQKWREAMTGSLSLYDKHGERLHTIYVGAAPEYGKETFFDRMEREIVRVKKLYSTAHFVGIADGARSNWDFLGPHIDEQILDFYHATQYLARAAAAMRRNIHRAEILCSGISMSARTARSGACPGAAAPIRCATALSLHSACRWDRWGLLHRARPSGRPACPRRRSGWWSGRRCGRRSSAARRCRGYLPSGAG